MTHETPSVRKDWSGRYSFLPAASPDLKGEKRYALSIQIHEPSWCVSSDTQGPKESFLESLATWFLRKATERWSRMGKPMYKAEFCKTWVTSVWVLSWHTCLGQGYLSTRCMSESLRFTSILRAYRDIQMLENVHVGSIFKKANCNVDIS